MNITTRNLLDQIMTDKKLLENEMPQEADASAIASLSAFLFASAGQKADIEKYITCMNYLKEYTKVFSEVQGTAAAIIITRMCLSIDYKTYLMEFEEVLLKLLKVHQVSNSPYMVLSALNIYEAGGLANTDENIAKLESSYKNIKMNYYWLTSGEDHPFIAMLESRNIDVPMISANVAECIKACHSMPFPKEAIHTAAQIMALSDKVADVKVAELKATLEAFVKFKIRGLKYELIPVAATLGLIEKSPEVKALSIKENYNYLKYKEGYDSPVSEAERTLYSVFAYAIENFNQSDALINSVADPGTTTVFIEEVLLMIIIYAASNDFNHI